MLWMCEKMWVQKKRDRDTEKENGKACEECGRN